MTIAEYAATTAVLSWSQRLRWRRSIAGLRTSPGRKPRNCLRLLCPRRTGDLLDENNPLDRRS